MKKESYRPIYNPMIPFFRLGMITLFWGIPIYVIYKLVKEENYELEIILPALFILFFFGYVGLQHLISSLNEVKIVKFQPTTVRVTYLLKLKTLIYQRSQIRGFSKSEIRSIILRIPSLILYTEDEHIIEFIKFNYLDFKKLEQFMMNEYSFLGTEAFTPKPWFGRIYQFRKR